MLIKFWPSCTPGRGSAVGWNFLAPPYYSVHAVFASLWALFLIVYLCCPPALLLCHDIACCSETAVRQQLTNRLHAMNCLLQMPSPWQLGDQTLCSCCSQTIHVSEFIHFTYLHTALWPYSVVCVIITLCPSEAVTQCIVIAPVYLCVCYHDNSKLRASILTKLGLQVKVVTISSWLHFGHPVPPGRGSVPGWNLWLCLTNQRTVLASHPSAFLI